jgi:hypothetical protein
MRPLADLAIDVGHLDEPLGGSYSITSLFLSLFFCKLPELATFNQVTSLPFLPNQPSP